VIVPVAAVSVTPATASLTVGQTQQLTASARDSAGTVLTGRAVGFVAEEIAHGFTLRYALPPRLTRHLTHGP
jgi:hypothetical protein